MKKLWTPLLTVCLLVGLVLVGCESPLEPILGDAAGATDSEAPALSKDGLGPIITGSFHTTFLGRRVRAARHVVQTGSGSQQGQYEIHILNNRFSLHGELECATVVGNEAWIAGRWTRSNCEGCFPLGHAFGFRVRDNGEPPDNPDEASTIYQFPGNPTGFPAPVLGDNPQDWCDAQLAVPLVVDSEGGNIKIH